MSCSLILISFLVVFACSDACDDDPEVVCVDDIVAAGHYANLNSAILASTGASSIRFVYLTKDIDMDTDEPVSFFTIDTLRGKNVTIMPHPVLVTDPIIISSGTTSITRLFSITQDQWRISGGPLKLLKLEIGTNVLSNIMYITGAGVQIDNLELEILVTGSNFIAFDLYCSTVGCSQNVGMAQVLRNVVMDVIACGGKGLRGVRIRRTRLMEESFVFEGLSFPRGSCYTGIRFRISTSYSGVVIRNNDFSGCEYGVRVSSLFNNEFLVEGNRMIGGSWFFAQDNGKGSCSLSGCRPGNMTIRNNYCELVGVPIQLMEVYVDESYRFVSISDNTFVDCIDTFVEFTVGAFGLPLTVPGLELEISRNYFKNERMSSMDQFCVFMGLGITVSITNNIFEKTDSDFSEPFIVTESTRAPYNAYFLRVTNNLFLCGGSDAAVLSSVCTDPACFSLDNALVSSNVFIGDRSGGAAQPVIIHSGATGELCNNTCLFSRNVFKNTTYVVTVEPGWTEIGTEVLSDIPFRAGDFAIPYPYYVPNLYTLNVPYIAGLHPATDMIGQSRGIQKLGWMTPGPFEVPCPGNYTGADCEVCVPGRVCCNGHWESETCDYCPVNWDSDDDCSSCANFFYGEDCQACPPNFDITTNCAVCFNHWEGLNCETCPERYDSLTDCVECTAFTTGDDCLLTTCYGQLSNESTVCSGHGACESYFDCVCDTDYVGAECDSKSFESRIREFVLTYWYVVVVVAIFLIILCLVIIVLVILCCIPIVKRTKKITHDWDRFKQLRNIEFLLKEQKAKEAGNTNPFNIKVDSSIFSIRFEDVELIQELGSGGSDSVVYKASWKGRAIAFKVFKCTSVSQDSMEEFQHEVSLLSSVNHPNIISFYGACANLPRVGIVLEFCQKGDLSLFVWSNRDEGVPTSQKVRFFEEISSAVEYLHERDIIHRDLKLANVLLDDAEHCRLIDFGLSKVVESMTQNTKHVGTSFYIAPEVTLGTSYASPCDVFSFGMVMYCLITMDADPFHGVLGNIEVMLALDPNFRPSWEGADKHPGPEWIKRLVEQCWADVAEERPTIEQVRTVLMEKGDAGDDGDSGKLLAAELAKRKRGPASTPYVSKASVPVFRRRQLPLSTGAVHGASRKPMGRPVLPKMPPPPRSSFTRDPRTTDGVTGARKNWDDEGN